MRVSIDTGGTFTDLVVEDEGEPQLLFKSPTTPDDPVEGIIGVLELAACDAGLDLRSWLERVDVCLHATTRSLNAVVTRSVARTAFLTTEGHRDMLLLREGGRADPFDFSREYPRPLVPRALTFEVRERVDARGRVVTPLDEERLRSVFPQLIERKVEAVGVCLLWSVLNPAHELRVGELFDECLPDLPYTLSHRLTPAVREYRRASAACIDASLKPVMTEYMSGLADRLRRAGFRGRLLAVTAGGGVADASLVAAAPIHSIGSGPAMAPVAGRFCALEQESLADDLIVTDAGGTTYDVSVVRRGRIPQTRETWIGGDRTSGHITGFPSVDVRSIGAGGGSIAWVDSGGLLRLGPESAGAQPGPAAYGRGGLRPTVTDAAVVLGYIDPDWFLDGSLPLDPEAAHAAVREHVGIPLGVDLEVAAAAVLNLATEQMAQAIEEITLYQGIDPRGATLVAGGGAAGLNAVFIGQRLGCPKLLVPRTASVLSASGALVADLAAEFGAVHPTDSASFDFAGANRTLEDLRARCREFVASLQDPGATPRIELSAEVRYPRQVWELEVPLRHASFAGAEEVAALRQDFCSLHTEVFGIADADSDIEVVAWRARVAVQAPAPTVSARSAAPGPARQPTARDAYVPSTGMTEVAVWPEAALTPGEDLEGPAIIEAAATNVVVAAGARATRTSGGHIAVQLGSGAAPKRVEAKLGHDKASERPKR